MATPITTNQTKQPQNSSLGTRQFTPIAPAPAKIYQPQTIMLQQPTAATQNLPILTQGPNGTMLLVSNPASAGVPQPQTFTATAPSTSFMFPQPQFYPSVMLQQPLIYGMPTIFQPQVQTFVSATIQQPRKPLEEITIVEQPQPPPAAPKLDILERAILEIGNDTEEVHVETKSHLAA